MGPGALLHFDLLLRTGTWSVLYQIPIACLALYLGLATRVEQRPRGMQLWKLLGAIAVPATLLFLLVLWIIPGMIGLLVACVAMYVFVMVAIDKLLALHLEHAHEVTGFVCVVTWLLWIITGGAVMVARAL